MHIVGYFIKMTSVSALLLCFTLSSAFAAAQVNEINAIGEVIFLTGTVMAEQPDGTKRQLGMNSFVVPRDVIVTGCKSNIEIMFKDESVYSQGPESRIELDDFVYSTDRTASKLLFKMGKGTFRYVTGIIVKTNPDAFALETPTTTIGIRGTEIFAEISPTNEEIGNTKISKGHTMTVGDKTIGTARTSVNVNPATGAISDPAPTSQKTIDRVIKSAPMTSQGEYGGQGASPQDLDNTVSAFQQQLQRTKQELGNLGNKPDYGELHKIQRQKEGKTQAERDRDSNDASNLGGGSEGAETGGGGRGQE